MQDNFVVIIILQ